MSQEMLLNSLIKLFQTNISGLIKEVRGEEREEQQLEPHFLQAFQEIQEDSNMNPQNPVQVQGKKKRLCEELPNNPTDSFLSTPQTIPVEEECQNFGNFIASKLKNYSSRTRCSIQHAISSILFTADRGQFENYHPNTFRFTDDIETVNDGVTPNFYSVILNSANQENIKQELALSSNEASPTLEN